MLILIIIDRLDSRRDPANVEEPKARRMEIYQTSRSFSTILTGGFDTEITRLGKWSPVQSHMQGCTRQSDVSHEARAMSLSFQ